MPRQYAFGTGVLFAQSTMNASANPIEFGSIQSVTFDFTWTTKSLFGQYAIAQAIGRGTGKLTGKASVAQFNAQIFNDIFLGNAMPSANKAIHTAVNELQTVATGNATCNHPNSFIADLGVFYSSNGGLLTYVASGPTGDQYTTAANGVYVFNTSLNGAKVFLSYTFQNTGNLGTGTNIPWSNNLIGAAPEFSLVFNTQFNGQAATLIFNACTSTKLSIATKIEDFTIPDFDFEIKADSSNTIGSLNFDQ